MNAARDLHRLLDRALGDDAHHAIVSARQLDDEVSGWMTERAVLNARRTGMSWAAIARLLRQSRQAVHRRFRHLDRIASVRDLPRRPDSMGAARRANLTAERLIHERAADRERRHRLADDEAIPW